MSDLLMQAAGLLFGCLLFLAVAIVWGSHKSAPLAVKTWGTEPADSETRREDAQAFCPDDDLTHY